MYFVIKKDKAKHIDNNLHKVKETICDIIEEFMDSREEYSHEEDYGRESARRDGRRYMDRDYDYYDDDRDMARGRGGRGIRGRY